MAETYVNEVTLGGCEDVYVVDVGLFGLENYGAVYVVDAERPAIIDTGSGKNHERILEALELLDIDREEVGYVLPTHVHLDHAGGTGYLAEACPNATVGIHRLGARHLSDPGALVEGTKRAVGADKWDYYGEPIPVPDDRITEFTGGEQLDLGGETLRVHHAPGHAPHQVVFENPENDLVFAADAAGNYFQELGFTRALSPPPDFDLEGCLDDIGTLRSLDPTVLCYAHFGPTVLGEQLDLFEEVLVDWVDAIAAKRREFEDDDAVVDYFASRNGVTHIWPERQAYDGTAMNVRGVLHYLDGRDET